MTRGRVVREGTASSDRLSERAGKSEAGPTEAGARGVASLQSTIGNRATMRLLRRGRPLVVQAKLAVSAPEQPEEREADRVAEAVAAGRPAATRAAPLAAGNVEASAAVEGRIRARQGGGSPIAGPLRGAMERSLGADLSRVRVHTDGEAHALSTSLRARAFTTGRDIFFRRGEYDPGSAGGRRLVAHELAHVVQQSAAGQPRIHRELMTVDKFRQDSKSGFTEGELYKTIVAALTAYHKAKDEAGAKQAALRSIAVRCAAWLHKHAKVDFDAEGAVRYTGDKNKSKGRLDPILALKREADAEYEALVGTAPRRVDPEERPIVNVYTGQGAVVDLREYSLGSAGFLSCSPVVMYNHRTHIGGLYHFASESLDKQKHELINMAEAVAPTEIHLFPGGYSIQSIVEDYLQDPDQKPYGFDDTVSRPIREWLTARADPDPYVHTMEIVKDAEKLREAAYQASDMRVLHDFFAFATRQWRTVIHVQKDPMSSIFVGLGEDGLAVGPVYQAHVDLAKLKSDEDLAAPGIRAYTSEMLDITAGKIG